MVEYVKNGAWNTTMMKLKKYRYPALILALGLLLLLLPAGNRQETTQKAQSKAEPSAAEAESGDFNLTAFTKEAEDLLSQIQGAGTVKLLLTLETDGRRDYLADLSQSQSDSGQQSQTETVLTSQSGGETPVVLGRSYPEFRGAVVLCQGADSASLTLSIKEALSSLTGLGMDKITVLKMN